MVVGVVGVGLGEDARPVVEPLARHLPAVELLAEDEHLARAVHDLGMVVHGEDARHDAHAVARPLDHGQGVALRAADAARLVADGHRARRPAVPAGAMRSYRRWSTMRSRRWSGRLVRELAEPGVLDGLVGEHVLEDPRALAALVRRAQHGLGHVRPPAHHAEAVAHREEGGVGGVADAGRTARRAGAPRPGPRWMPCVPSAPPSFW